MSSRPARDGPRRRRVAGLVDQGKDDAMRHLRRTVVAAVADALCVAPVARAQDSQEHARAVVTRATDQLLGEFWARIYSLPVSENP